MEKFEVSRSLTVYQYLLYAAILFCLFLIAKSYDNTNLVVSVGIITIIFFVAAYRMYFSSAIEFDLENMYVSNKRGDDVIPLKKVQAVKLTSFRINRENFWKVNYYDNSDIEQTVRFLPVYKNLDPFIEKVKDKNPTVVIKYSTDPFDLG